MAKAGGLCWVDFYPDMTAPTVRHHQDRDFIELADFITSLIQDRFEPVEHEGSYSWCWPGNRRLTIVKLCFHDAPMAFGLRTEPACKHSSLSEFDFWDRVFQVPPQTGPDGAWFVGFSVSNDHASRGRVQQVIARLFDSIQQSHGAQASN